MSRVSEKQEFMTTTEATEYLGVSNPTLVSWAKQLGITSYLGARNTRNYRKSDIERIYQEKLAPKPAPPEE